MKKISTLVIGICLLLGTVLAAETLMIQSMSGDVKIKKDVGGTWESAKVKDKIDDSAFIQVAKGATAQLVSQSGTIIRIDIEKTVRLSELNSAMKGNSVNAKLNNIKNKLMAKGSDTGNGPTAVAGVRGDNVYEQNKAALKHDLYWEQ